MTKRIGVLGGVVAVLGTGVVSAQLVDLDFTTQPLGPATSVTNGGTLGGAFENFGGGANDPQIEQSLFSVPRGFPTGTPGTAGLAIDGNDFLTHRDGGNFVDAPAGIIGVDRTSSVEAWVFNPSVAAEETVVAWGRRGGPVGTNASHNYGNAQAFGAVGHWGGQDIGWDPALDGGATAGPAPAAGEWHHLGYTYDGTTTRVYIDGVLANSEVLGPGAINTHGGTPITVGGQLGGASVSGAPDFGDLVGGTMTIGAVRVWDEVLSDAQILDAFNARSGDFVAAQPPAAPTPTALRSAPQNRYTFNLGEVVGDGSSGTQVNDVIGGAHGQILGDGATLTGTQVDLPGGSSATAAYVDLPNGLVSSKSAANGGSGEVSLEFWATNQGNQAWSRFFDFGSTMFTGDPADGGSEVVGPGNTNGGGNEGVDYLIWSAQIGGDNNANRLEWNNRDAPVASNLSDITGATPGTEFHGVMTVNEATGEVVAFINGELVTFFDIPAGLDLSEINDVNNWLGRSNWQGDANGDIAFNEFRVYGYALNRDEVAGNFVAGPDNLNVIPEPGAVVLVALTGLGLILRRRRS